MSVAPGCDALQAVTLFMFAIIAFPVRISWAARLVPLLIGSAILIAVNFVRITSLYYVGANWPQHFERVHIDVWQSFFVVFPVFLWLTWALWAMKRARKAAIRGV